MYTIFRVLHIANLVVQDLFGIVPPAFVGEIATSLVVSLSFFGPCSLLQSQSRTFHGDERG
jgi:hypothetical protein